MNLKPPTWQFVDRCVLLLLYYLSLLPFGSLELSILNNVLKEQGEEHQLNHLAQQAPGAEPPHCHHLSATCGDYKWDKWDS